MYDGLNVKVRAAVLSEFHEFYKQTSELSVLGRSKGMAETGPSRHKSTTLPVTFASSLTSRDWTAADEWFLREAFWASAEFHAHAQTFERLLGEELRKGLANERLFCERISACKPLFQCVGIFAFTFKSCLFVLSG